MAETTNTTDGYSKIDTIQLPGTVSGHGDIVAYDAETQTVWLSQSPDNNVVVIDTQTNTVKATIPNIGNANGIAFSPKYAFVADVTNDTVDVIDKKTYQVLDKVPVSGTTPDGVAFISSTKQVTIASDDANTLDFISAKKPFNEVSSTQLVPNPSPPGPDVQTYSPQTDRIYQPDDQDIDVINPHTGAITKTFNVLAGAPASANVKPPVYDAQTNNLVVGTTNNELLVVNADSGAVTSTIPIAGSVDEGVIDAATRTAFFAGSAGFVYAVDLDTDKLVGTIPTQAGTHSLAVDPTTGNLYVYEGNSNTVDVFSQNAVCFTSGALIRTVRGDVAVEALAVGDLAVTAAGEHRPIRWIGSRVTHCRRHPEPHNVMPVRVRAGAFGPSRPARDLVVSPGHALCVDICGDVLIPAVALINGSTVVQEEVESVTYWHVELDSHDILLAENMPAESYLDMANRRFFARSTGDDAVVDFAALPDVDTAVRTHADFCRPFHAGGPVVEAIRDRMRRRSEALGWRMTDEVDAYLDCEGVQLTPVVRNGALRFTLPAGVRDVWLVAPASRPCDVGLSADNRMLGLFVRGLHIEDGLTSPCSIAVDDPLLCIGFHAVERDGEGAYRWTTERARLPARLWADRCDGCHLRIDLAAGRVPCWVEPGSERTARQAGRLATAMPDGPVVPMFVG